MESECWSKPQGIRHIMTIACPGSGLEDQATRGRVCTSI